VNRYPLYIVSFLLALGTMLSWGQTDDTAPAPAFGPELPYTEVLIPPLPVNSVRMPLTFSSENPRSNFVMGNVQLSSAYDDNVLATPNGHIGDVSYLMLPSLAVGQTRERWNWDLSYSPGFTINQRVTERNQVAHNLHLLLGYRLSPHVTVQLQENFEKSNSLFSGMLGVTPTSGPGPLQQPNQSAITPLVERTGNTTGLDLSYQFSASGLVGANGNFYLANYESPAGSGNLTYGLIDSRSWGGNAYYAHRFSNRHWTGLTYGFQRFLFDPGYRTDVNRVFWFYSLPLGARMTFSLWAGPEYTTNYLGSTLGPSAPGMGNSPAFWGGAAGAAWMWQGARTSFRTGYTRQTSDGGGLAQAVRLEQVDGEIRERLGARWTASLQLAYASNTPLNAIQGVAPFRSLLGDAGLEYRFTNNLRCDLHYGRDQLTYQFPAVPEVLSNRNRAWFSISYSFSRPLGR
jgi:hypothetical protein